MGKPSRLQKAESRKRRLSIPEGISDQMFNSRGEHETIWRHTQEKRNMIIPNERTHPFGCYMCGWAKMDPDEECLCDIED